jgi:hypothetical protein
MSDARLYDLIEEATVPLRQGPLVILTEADGTISGLDSMEDYEQAMDLRTLREQEPPAQVEVFQMAHRDSYVGQVVDCYWISVGVDKEYAEAHRLELALLLQPWAEALRVGPSYYDVETLLGDQEGALRLFALGSVLDWWRVVVPAGANARLYAEGGAIFMTGWDGQVGPREHPFLPVSGQSIEQVRAALPA